MIRSLSSYFKTSLPRSVSRSIWTVSSLLQKYLVVRFEVFTEVNVENAVFWDVCSLQPPAHAGSSLAGFSTLMMEAIRSSETSVHTRSTLHHIPEDGILQVYSYLDSCLTTGPSARRTKDLFKLNRDQLRWVIGLLTAHYHLKGQFFKLGLIDDPNCERCLQHISHVIVRPYLI
jgi:hypothetical protein